MKRKVSGTKVGTKAVWAGENYVPRQGPTQVPIVQSIAFGFADLDEWRDVALGKRRGYIYSRNTNPTVSALEEKVRDLEGAQDCTSFATGMAAVSDTLHSLLSPGDRLVTIKDTYGGTNQLFREFLPRSGVEVRICDTTDFEGIEAMIAEGCRLVYLETPTNPTLNVVDISRISSAAHAVGALVVTDSTLATPVNQLPLTLGSDIVLHSASKFLGGHADALGGLVCGRKELVEKTFHYREITGASLDPLAAYLLLRGLKTLELRVKRQNSNAMMVAEFLEGHPRVAGVFYPGLKSHPQHHVAKKQMFGGYGGVLSFVLKGGLSAVRRVLPRLQLAHRAANLGAVETTVGTPATTSHVEVSAKERAALGIPESLVRYSAGIEDPGDLITDIRNALAA